MSVLTVLLAMYFLPTLLAAIRGHCSLGGIFFVNFFLGWTFIGWVAAFFWALTCPGPRHIIVAPYPGYYR